MTGCRPFCCFMYYLISSKSSQADGCLGLLVCCRLYFFCLKHCVYKNLKGLFVAKCFCYLKKEEIGFDSPTNISYGPSIVFPSSESCEHHSSEHCSLHKLCDQRHGWAWRGDTHARDKKKSGMFVWTYQLYYFYFRIFFCRNRSAVSAIFHRTRPDILTTACIVVAWLLLAYC